MSSKSSTPQSASKTGKFTRFEPVLKYLAIAVITFFWGKYLYDNHEDLAQIDWFSSPITISGSLLLFILGYGVVGCMWSPFLKIFTGIDLRLIESFRICAFSWAGRYIPGKIWTLATKATLSSQNPGDMKKITVATVLEAACYIGSGAYLCLIFLPFSGLQKFAPELASVSLLLVGLLLLLMHPKISHALINFLLKKLKREPVNISLSFTSLLLLITGYMSTFFIWSLAFMVYASTLVNFEFDMIAFYTVLFTCAWVSGLLAIFAPAGIGVRESILAVGLTQILHLTPAQVVTLTVGARILTTLAEAICLVVAYMLTLSVNFKKSEITS